jgi:hypothetical protein
MINEITRNKHRAKKLKSWVCPTCGHSDDEMPEPPMWILAVAVSFLAICILVMAHSGKC